MGYNRRPEKSGYMNANEIPLVTAQTVTPGYDGAEVN